MVYRPEIPDYAEDAAILRFYQLDSLEPEVWTDQISSPVDDLLPESALQQFSRKENEFLDAQENENANDLQVLDDSDPLGIRSSIFEQ